MSLKSRLKNCTSWPSWGGGNLDEIQKNRSLFRDVLPNGDILILVLSFLIASIIHRTILDLLNNGQFVGQ